MNDQETRLMFWPFTPCPNLQFEEVVKAIKDWKAEDDPGGMTLSRRAFAVLLEGTRKIREGKE